MSNETVTTYTTAPPEYDWAWSKSEGAVGHTTSGKFTKTIRKVVTEKGREEAQRGRYGSGLHMAVDEAEFNKLVSYGLVVLG